MTETEWQRDTNVHRLLHFLSRKRNLALKRKLLLFECACCQRISQWLTDQRSLKAVELAERYAEEPGKLRGLKGVVKAAYQVGAKAGKYAVRNYSAAYAAALAACQLLRYHEDKVSNAAWGAMCTALSTIDAVANEYPTECKGFIDWKVAIASKWNKEGMVERNKLAEVLRDIVGNPFRRPPRVSPCWLAWNDGTVLKIAQTIYDERRFEDIPILADALEDAGCDDEDILRHCREAGEHVRGCWVVDLLLEKELN